MSNMMEPLKGRGRVAWVVVAGLAMLVMVAVSTPHLMRARMADFRSGDEGTRQPAAGSYEERIRENDHGYGYGPARKIAEHNALMSLSASLESPAAAKADQESIDRKMVRTSSVDLVVQRPAEAAEKIRALAEGMGGFLVSSEINGGTDATGGTLTVRVPAARFEEARAAIRKLGLRVENEKVEAQDVTRQYVDQQASLRNLRAEEEQLLSILKHATTVKDTLEVSEKLSDVRGQIDQQQAEFEALAKQIETVAITVSLRAEAQAQVLGLNWRPLYQMKMALRDGLEAVGDYGTSMMAFVFYLPAVLLWMVTTVAGAGAGMEAVEVDGADSFWMAEAGGDAERISETGRGARRGLIRFPCSGDESAWVGLSGPRRVSGFARTRRPRHTGKRAGEASAPHRQTGGRGVRATQANARTRRPRHTGKRAEECPRHTGKRAGQCPRHTGKRAGE